MRIEDKWISEKLSGFGDHLNFNQYLRILSPVYIFYVEWWCQKYSNTMFKVENKDVK